MPKYESIPVASLLIDAGNPRLSEEPTDQREAIRAVAAQQKAKLVALATDIVEHGINPADRAIVMPAQDQQNRYVVLEGNRRLSALRILENPNLIVGAVTPTAEKRFRSLSRTYSSNPIEKMDCVVFDTEPEADHWITLRHTGENDGAGIVPWGADETARYRQRRGDKVYHLQVLDFLQQRGELSSEDRTKVPVSSLERILSNPDIRAMLGLEMKDRMLYTRFDEDEVAKGLSYIVDDLASRRIRTTDIYHKEDRIRYAKSIPTQHLPDTSQPISEPRLLTATQSAPDANPTKPSRSRPSERRRKKLIPKGCVLVIDVPRINDIYLELKKISVEVYPNATAVLLRVFLELSLDAYGKKNLPSWKEAAKLHNKLTQVGEALHQQ